MTVTCLEISSVPRVPGSCVSGDAGPAGADGPLSDSQFLGLSLQVPQQQEPTIMISMALKTSTGPVSESKGMTLPWAWPNSLCDLITRASFLSVILNPQDGRAEPSALHP